MPRINMYILLLAGLFLLFACADNDDNFIPKDVNDDVISGTVQKGPFLIGSTINLYELDTDLNQTGVSFQTETIDTTGKYTLPARLNTQYVALFAQGYYFDEISGYASSAPLSLSALAEVRGDSTVNLNILTTLAKPRIRSLIEDGYDFQTASAMAHQSVIAMFNISVEALNTDFTQMQIFESGQANAFLLAASVILMQMAHDTEKGLTPTATLSETLSMAGIDLETDGQLDNDELMSGIADAKQHLDLTQIRTVLESEFPNVVIPDFESYLPEQGIVTGVISGSVLYKGQGLSGVEILLRDDMSQTRYQYTDNTGWYRFDGVLAGTFQVIPRKDGFHFIPEQLEVYRIAAESSVADFEAIATAKVFYDLNEFLAVTGDNDLIDFEGGADQSIIPTGELMQELVGLGHEFWFSGQASPPTFVLCNNPGFDVYLSTDAQALGFHYAPFASDTFLGESLIQWTLFNEAGEIIETNDALAIGFLNRDVDQHFFGIVSPQPFRSVFIRRIRADGTDGFGNWMFDDVRWAVEVQEDLF